MVRPLPLLPVLERVRSYKKSEARDGA